MNLYEKLKEIKPYGCRGCNLFRTSLCFFEIYTPNKYCCGDQARSFDQQELKSWGLDSLKLTPPNVMGPVIPQLLC